MSVEHTETIEVKVPVSEEYITAIRLFVSGLGARLSLDVDRMEDLKLAVTEAFLTIVERCEGKPGRITITWKVEDNHLSLAITDPSHKVRAITSSPNIRLVKELPGVEYVKGVHGGSLEMGFDLTKPADGRIKMNG